MDIERAQAIADVSQAVINTVKAETDMLRVTGQTNTSEFIPTQVKIIPKRPLPSLTPPAEPGLADQLAGANVRTHRMAG